MTKKTLWIAFLGMFLFLNPTAYADPMGGDGHSMGKHGYGMMDHHHGQSQCPVADKFMKKAHYLLENQADLGLTADQVKAIKDLKLQAEKDSIRQKADSQVFMLDLKSKLEEDKIDVEGTNALIDKGFASMATATKVNLEAYAKLKSTLTPDQLAKMKELWKNKKEERQENKEE